MKIRNIPYGYCYVNGMITVQENEAEIIHKVCNEYLGGKSLLQICEWLNDKKIEYMTNVVAWNKARICRLISDDRYMGNDKFPQIVDKEIYDKMIALKRSKNHQVGTDRKKEIYNLNVSILCPKCNNIMRRRLSPYREIKVRWDCTNPSCNCVIIKDDQALLDDINNTLNQVINGMITIEEIVENQEENINIEMIRLNNELATLCNNFNVDIEKVREKMIECTALKYETTSSVSATVQRLKDTFMSAKTTVQFNMKIFDETVDAIRLYEDKSVGIILTNKQEIKSGGCGGSSSEY